jgi:3-oxoadipate enol-lactonase
MFPLERSRALAAGIPGARFEVVPGGSHAIVIEKPAEVARILQEFLASVT